ncbi:hypothetical protein ACWGJX_48295, partial [Streptomyces sp. NPDC054775]
MDAISRADPLPETDPRSSQRQPVPHLPQLDRPTLAAAISRAQNHLTPTTRPPTGTDLQTCLTLVEHLRTELYPHIRPLHTLDDTLTHTRPGQERIAPGQGWQPVTTWHDLTTTVT